MQPLTVKDLKEILKDAKDDCIVILSNGTNELDDKWVFAKSFDFGHVYSSESKEMNILEIMGRYMSYPVKNSNFLVLSNIE